MSIIMAPFVSQLTSASGQKFFTRSQDGEKKRVGYFCHSALERLPIFGVGFE